MTAFEPGRRHAIVAAVAITGVCALAARAQVVPLGDEFRVNTETNGGQGAPAVASGGSGRFVVVWSGPDPAAPTTASIRGQRYDDNGVPTGTEFQVSTVGSYGYPPSVAMGDDGAFLVAWYDREPKIMARTFDAGGAPLSEPFRVDTTIFGVTCCPFAYDDIKGSPEVSTASGGHFVVVWSGGYNQYQYFVHYRREMFGQVVAPGGNLEGPEFSAGGDGYYYSYLPDVATDAEGQFVVVWGAVTGYEYYYDNDDNLQRQGNYAVQARRYSGGGAGITPEVDVGPLGLEGPKVASHKDGDFVVTWTQPGKLLSRRYDAQAVPKGDAFEVSTSEGTSADTERREPNTAVADAGTLVVVWTEGSDSIPESPDGSGAGILGRTYAADGTALGEEIVVNAYTTGNQSAPAVAFTGPDDLVVTWESGGEIVARRFGRAPACGDATADGARTVTDALVALNAALGLANCASCVCDADDSERISATDALRILRSVVDGPILLSCAPC